MKASPKLGPPPPAGSRTLFLSCKQAVRLQSTGAETELTPWQRLGLRLHLLVCGWCRRYRQQVAFLREESRPPHSPAPTALALPAEARERIRRALQNSRP